MEGEIEDGAQIIYLPLPRDDVWRCLHQECLVKTRHRMGVRNPGRYVRTGDLTKHLKIEHKLFLFYKCRVHDRIFQNKHDVSMHWKKGHVGETMEPGVKGNSQNRNKKQFSRKMSDSSILEISPGLSPRSRNIVLTPSEHGMSRLESEEINIHNSELASERLRPGYHPLAPPGLRTDEDDVVSSGDELLVQEWQVVRQRTAVIEARLHELGILPSTQEVGSQITPTNFDARFGALLRQGDTPSTQISVGSQDRVDALQGMISHQGQSHHQW